MRPRKKWYVYNELYQSCILLLGAASEMKHACRYFFDICLQTILMSCILVVLVMYIYIYKYTLWLFNIAI